MADVRREFRNALVVLGLALSLCGCSSADRSIRYKFTIEVDDNGTLRRGSTVQEHVCSFNDGLLKGLGNALTCGTAGEALTVDLGEKGILFAVMATDLERRSWPPLEILFVAANGARADGSPQTLDNIAKLGAKQIDIPVAELPLLVRFRDISNPDSVERVDPLRLDVKFGPGVRINKASVELTKEPVTTGIEKILNNKYYNQSFYVIPDQSDPYRYSIRLDSSSLMWPKRR